MNLNVKLVLLLIKSWSRSSELLMSVSLGRSCFVEWWLLTDLGNFFWELNIEWLNTVIGATCWMIHDCWCWCRTTRLIIAWAMFWTSRVVKEKLSNCIQISCSWRMAPIYDARYNRTFIFALSALVPWFLDVSRSFVPHVDLIEYTQNVHTEYLAKMLMLSIFEHWPAVQRIKFSDCF